MGKPGSDHRLSVALGVVSQATGEAKPELDAGDARVHHAGVCLHRASVCPPHFVTISKPYLPCPPRTPTLSRVLLFPHPPRAHSPRPQVRALSTMLSPERHFAVI